MPAPVYLPDHVLAAARAAAPALERLRASQSAEVVPFAPVQSRPSKSPREVAPLYFSHPEPRPHGLIKQLAQEHGVNLGSLHARIFHLRRRGPA